MQLTVRNLLEIPALKIRLLSQDKGIDRKVIWAHTSELANPSEWVQENSLIMTTGLGIPQSEDEQKKYIQRIIDAGLSALLISDQMSAPKDLDPLIQIANEHNFPVCYIDYHTPFSEVTRIVNDANKDKKDIVNQQLNKILYDNMQGLIKEHSITELITHIRNLLNIPIYLINAENPEETLFSCDPTPQNILHRLMDFNFKTTEIQKIYKKSDITLHAIPLQSQGFMLIVADNNISIELLQNLALLFGLYIESRKNLYYQRIIQGGELLEDIQNENVNESYIDKKLASLHIKTANSHIFISDFQKNIDYKKTLFRSGFHGLVLFRKDRIIIMAEQNYLMKLTKLTKIFTNIGMSDAIKKTQRIHDAFQEASLAFKNCSEDFPIQNYAQQNYSRYTLPKNLEEAQRIFEFNLGSLYENDQAKNTRYIHTLKAFLENDRAWEKTSKILHIHKQTLVYRVQKIQEMTGRQFNSTADIVELWIALKAGEILNIIEE